jgi:hypothetical protein
MKFWDDEKLLMKISQKLGGAMPAPAAPAAPQKPPEVTNLFEACRWGDLEAAEDFIAIGKGVNEADKEGRTPLYVTPLRHASAACFHSPRCVLLQAFRRGVWKRGCRAADREDAAGERRQDGCDRLEAEHHAALRRRVRPTC